MFRLWSHYARNRRIGLQHFSKSLTFNKLAHQHINITGSLTEFSNKRLTTCVHAVFKIKTRRTEQVRSKTWSYRPVAWNFQASEQHDKIAPTNRDQGLEARETHQPSDHCQEFTINSWVPQKREKPFEWAVCTCVCVCECVGGPRGVSVRAWANPLTDEKFPSLLNTPIGLKRTLARVILVKLTRRHDVKHIPNHMHNDINLASIPQPIRFFNSQSQHSPIRHRFNSGHPWPCLGFRFSPLIDPILPPPCRLQIQFNQSVSSQQCPFIKNPTSPSCVDERKCLIQLHSVRSSKAIKLRFLQSHRTKSRHRPAVPSFTFSTRHFS
jgi:hypothetical protein